MHVIQVNNDGKSPYDLFVAEAPRPETPAGHVLIRVSHAGVNRPDILQRIGAYPPPAGASPILGLEVSGTIESLNLSDDEARLLGWKLGDKVCALTNGGGYAEFVSVDARHLLPIPKGLTMAEAATLPEVALTVYANMMEGGGLKAGETVLIHGGNSGIGSMAIQMAKGFGAKVITTVRGADKAARVATFGADLVIDATAGDFVEAVKAYGGADVVIDIVGGDYTDRNLICLKPKGRLVQVGVGAGSKVTLDLFRIMQKQLTLTGSTLRPRTPDEKARLSHAVRDQVWPLIDAGAIKTVVEKEFSLDKAGEAHAWLEAGQHVGKVVLKIGG
jgi:putative PIG3 family NAD(P)H quinone oxidoreductase